MSLEYLMTYGLIISIAVIAIAILYSMDMFGAVDETGRTGINCFGDFACNKPVCEGTHMMLELRNGDEILENIACIAPTNCYVCLNKEGCSSSNLPAIGANEIFYVFVPGETLDLTATITYYSPNDALVTTRTQTFGPEYFE